MSTETINKTVFDIEEEEIKALKAALVSLKKARIHGTEDFGDGQVDLIINALTHCINRKCRLTLDTPCKMA